MPIYEYSCQKCHSDFELLVRGDAEPKCPNCGGKKLTRQFSVPAAHSSQASPLPPCGSPLPGGCGMAECGSGRCPLQ